MKELANKFLLNQVSVDEAEIVLKWLLTPEGNQFMIDHFEYLVNSLSVKLDEDLSVKADLSFEAIRKKINLLK